MPFESKAQVGKLFAKNPALARRWAHKYGIPKDLPRRKRKVRKVR